MQFPVVLVITERLRCQLLEGNVPYPRILPFGAGDVGVGRSNSEGNDPAPQPPVFLFEDEHNPVALLRASNINQLAAFQPSLSVRNFMLW